MNELVKSFKANLYDKVSSPLFGAFIISWCVWNWRLILIIFSDIPVYEKLSYIDTEIYSDIKIFICYLIAYPLVSSIAFLVFYPFPARLIFMHWRQQQQKLKEIQQKIDKETLISKEDAELLRIEIYETESKYLKEIERLNIKIKELDSNKNNETSNEDSHNEESSDIDKEFFDKYIDEISIILNSTIKNNGTLDLVQLTNKFDHKNKNIIEYVISTLIQLKYLKRTGTNAIYILPKGRKLLIDKGL